MSEEASTLALAPFVRIFVYSAIKSIRNKNLSETKYVLHADMVPKVTKKVMLASMGNGVIPPRSSSALEITASSKVAPGLNPAFHSSTNKQLEFNSTFSTKHLTTNIQKLNNINSQIPIHKQNLNPILPVSNPNLSRQNHPPIQQMIIPETPIKGEELTQFYGKITPLLGDLSVTVIECPGAGKPLMVVRRGQKSLSKIILNEADIGQILQKASDAAHIPLMNGVFRAAVDTFVINAVVSDIIGSRFVIKLQPTLSQTHPMEMPRH